MAHQELIFEMLKKDLSAPRVLLDQVVNYINDNYGYSSTDLPTFFQEKYPLLEDYEVDLTFSPQYTPAEHHRLEYIPVLGNKYLSVSDVATLKQRLNDIGLKTDFKTPDGLAEVVVSVHEVFIDRYVNLLRLDQKLPEVFHAEISSSVPNDSANEVNLLAREEVWQLESRHHILLAFLRVFKQLNNFSTLKVSFLTNFVRTYRPANLLDVERQLDSLVQSCQTDMENVSGRGFHDEYLKAMNEGNRLNKGNERDIWEHYKHMIDLAGQLKADFQQISQAAPEFLEEARLHQAVV